ncbi:AAA family ATPase [Humitalea sp. 24SJ18S-53]|uniref:bifunctional aminoglycoside phosphotransferase/ATP-binding protein n=1 Tax=Humitalea sp. 24SJ18S-53 TaxID=3422307 RepID=UPI003D665A0B
MTIPGPQQDSAALLGRLTGATPIETHISAVFVGAGAVFKLKKAVNLGFLDFTTLAAREHFLRREFTLNAPHAPGLYRAVLPIGRRDGALTLGALPAEEWVLDMAPVPPGDFLVAHPLDAPLLDALGDTVAALHAALPPLPHVDQVASLHRALAGNTSAALAAGLPADRVAALDAAIAARIDACAPVLRERQKNGFVRRCHGDLHLGNLLMWHGRPVPFDALEFDEALAEIDTGYDLAFLLMDLDRSAGRAAANRVLNRVVARSGDAGMFSALPAWMALRALIRAQCVASAGQDGMAFLDQASSYLIPAPAQVVAIGGLQGTGKSHLARLLAPDLGAAPGALILRSDEIRKRRHGVAPEAPLPDAAYTPAASAAVQAEMLSMLDTALRGGQSVVLDAMFLDPALRATVEDIALRAQKPFIGIWLDAPLDLLRARVAGRRGDASDATVAVLERSAAADTGPIGWTRLDAAQNAYPKARLLFPTA